MIGDLHRAFAEHRVLVAGRQGVDDPVVQIDGEARQPAALDRRRQFLDLHRVAGSEQHAAVGDQPAERVEQPGAGVGRLDQTAHHLARQIGEQVVALVAVTGDGALAERGGEDLALRPQGFKLAFDQAGLIAAEIEKAADQERQRQHVDREDAARQRREGRR